MSEHKKEDLRTLLQSISNSLKPEKKFFGLTVQSIAVLTSMTFAVAAFYYRTDDTVRRLVKLSEYAQEFMDNSDGYHSAATRTQFKQGKPIDSTFDTQYVRRMGGKIAGLEN